MKMNSWMYGVAGVLVGITSTLGVQAILNLPTPSSSSVQHDITYAGFAENRAFYSSNDASEDVAEALSLENWPEVIDQAYYIDELRELADGSYFILHEVEESWSSGTIIFSRLSHVTASNTVKWQYDLKPDLAYITPLFDFGYRYFDIDSEDILAFDDHVVLLTEFINYERIGEGFEPLFVGNAFRPIGADASNPMPYATTAVAINLTTYEFEVISSYYFDDLVGYEWEESEPFGEHYLLDLSVSVHPDMANPVTVFDTVIDLQVPNHDFFFELSYTNAGFIFTPLGSIHANVNLYFYVGGLAQMDNRWQATIDGYTSLVFEFRYYADWMEDWDSLIVNFSDDMTLISEAKQTVISNWFAAVNVEENFASAKLDTYAIIHTTTKAMLYERVLHHVHDGVANEQYQAIYFYFESLQDFIEVYYANTFNFLGEENSFQMITANSTITEYLMQTVHRVTEFTGETSLVVNQLIRTDHHFILGTTATTHALVDGNNDFRPVGLILLMDRDFNALDHLIINARADYWTDGMTIVNNTLYVLFWTPSLNPLFLDPITGDQYYSLILEVALQPAA